MGLFRSEEEKAAQARERAAAERAQAEKAEQVWLADQRARFDASVVGQARLAFAAGDRYYEAQIPHESMRGDDARTLREYALFGPMPQDASSPLPPGEGTDLIGSICDEGWRLVQSGWVYRVTHHESKQTFGEGQRTVSLEGEAVGMHLFVRDESLRRNGEVAGDS